MDAFDPSLNAYTTTGQPGYPHPHPQQHQGIQLGGQPHQDHNGTLQFEEDLKDIPQALANYGGAAPAAPPAAQPGQMPHFPSVLQQPPPAVQGGPVAGIPVNPAPQNMQAPLTPQYGPDGNPLPPKRPRGRPRKVPGTESRGPATPASGADSPSGRGRPKARGRGRGRGRGGRGGGRGGKRMRASSDEDDFTGDTTESDADGDEDEQKSVDLNEEVDDDFGTGKMAPTTKFGRKVSKPKTFVPTNKPTIQRKKRAPMVNLDANLMCQVCNQGHSPPENRLVICEACNRGWHQLCSVPTIEHSVVDSTLPWFCNSCDAKVSATKTPIDVSVGEGWTTGRGEEKGEGREAERENEYDEAIKKEWLETMPLHQLVGYVLSVEKKFAPLVDASSTSLPIWPANLPATVAEAKLQLLREAAEREAALERQAEELAAAQGLIPMQTPSAAGSEAGTPLTFDGALPGDTPARTAASRRAEAEAGPSTPGAASTSFAGAGASTSQGLHGMGAQQPQASFAPPQPHQPASSVPLYLRQPFNAQPALSGTGGASGSSVSPSGSPQPPFDIPVSASTSSAAAQANRYAPYAPAGSASPVPVQQQHAGFYGAGGGFGGASNGGYGSANAFAQGSGAPGGYEAMARSASGGGAPQ
ncbi:hypothetical protein NBRC10512v2_007737 [Rhodotorula toruloides]